VQNKEEKRQNSIRDEEENKEAARQSKSLVKSIFFTSIVYGNIQKTMVVRHRAVLDICLAVTSTLINSTLYNI
jgi:hypothetical protein